MKNFKLNLIEDLPVLERHDIEGVRYYTDAEGTIPSPGYPSVTSVLSADKSKSASLAKWVERIGVEAAEAVKFRAATRGTDVHHLIEDYILGRETEKKMMPNVIEMANGLKQIADDRIDNIRLVEGQLFSHHLQVAGTVDLVAEFDGELSIIDWKTSSRPKHSNHINNYYQQEAAYAVMFEERTNLPVRKLVTLVVHPEGTQMFIEDRDKWIGSFRELREEYDRQTSNSRRVANSDAERVAQL